MSAGIVSRSAPLFLASPTRSRFFIEGTRPLNPPTAEIAAFQKEVARVSAENDWAHYRRKAGIGTYSLAGLIFILPKIGPLTLAAAKGPTPTTEVQYLHSVIGSTSTLRHVLARFTPPPTTRSTAASAAAADTRSQPPPSAPLPAKPSAKQDVPRQSRDPRHPLPNRDLDTGSVVEPGGYSLTDSTYADLLHRLALQPSRAVPPAIKEDIEAYYANPDSPITTKKKPQLWARVQADLVTLQGIPTSTEPDPFPTYGDDTTDNPETP